MQTIAVVNMTTLATAAEIAAYVAAQRAQLQEDFDPAYGWASDCVGTGPGGPWQAGWWPMYLVDDQVGTAGALAWHAVNAQGLPYGIVPLARAKAAGVPWTEDASHECLEMRNDPWCEQTVEAYCRGRWVNWADEACDPVEDWAYSKNGVSLSDFVLPSWYRQGATGPVDFLGRLSAPMQLAPGGYAMYSISAGNWKQVLGKRVQDHNRTAHAQSRRERRKGP